MNFGTRMVPPRMSIHSRAVIVLRQPSALAITVRIMFFFILNLSLNVQSPESAILVATRSRPNPLPLESSYVSLGIDEIPELSPHFHDVHSTESVDWESWAQESNIDLCEVRLGFDGSRTREYCMIHSKLLNTNIAVVLYTTTLSPLRCDAYPLSSLVFCPGDPLQPTMAEPSSVHVVPKMYLCLSLLDFGKCDDRSPGVENRLSSGADSAIPKSELIVFGLFKRTHPHAPISEWVSFFLCWHLRRIFILRGVVFNKADVEAFSRDPRIYLTPLPIARRKYDCCWQFEGPRSSVLLKTKCLGEAFQR
jgi:hypothetical protein